jgi:hypothetical protein
MAGGTAAQMHGADKMEEEQKRILNRSMEETQKTQDQASADVAMEGANFSPEKRALDLAAQEQGAIQRAQADLSGTEGIVQSATKGNVSADFLKGKADKAISEGNRITDVVRESAKLRAPGQQMAEESIRRGALAGDLGSKWSSAGGMSRAAMLDAEGVEMPSIGQLGQIASMVGSVWAGGMGADAGAPSALGAGTEGMAGYTMPASGGAGVPAAAGGMASLAPSMMSAGTGLSGIWGGGQKTNNRSRAYESMFGQRRNR